MCFFLLLLLNVLVAHLYSGFYSVFPFAIRLTPQATFVVVTLITVHVLRTLNFQASVD